GRADGVEARIAQRGLDGLRVLLLEVVDSPVLRTASRTRVSLGGPCGGRVERAARFIEPSHRPQESTVRPIGLAGRRVEVDRASHLALSVGPAPIEAEQDAA